MEVTADRCERGHGGIRDQLTDGERGVLIEDPLKEFAAFGAAVERLLADPQEGARLGRNARVRAAVEFLGDRHLGQDAGALFASLG